jgi:hypothetical protein
MTKDELKPENKDEEEAFDALDEEAREFAKVSWLRDMECS